VTHPHDALDWFSAIGPTLAAFFAAWVAWATYKRGEHLQRQLTRPLVMFRHNFNLGNGAASRWILDLRNEGPTAANIEEFTILARGEIVSAEFFNEPAKYWRLVFARLTVFDHLGSLKPIAVSNPVTIRVPYGLAPNSAITLFDASFEGDKESFEKMVNGIELRVAYRSPVGELYRIASKRIGVEQQEVVKPTPWRVLTGKVLPWLTAAGLVISAAGTGMVWKYGLPQPSFEGAGAITAEDNTVEPNGKTVRQNREAMEAERTIYRTRAEWGLGLLAIGFVVQLAGEVVTRRDQVSRS
jgi:hypothetical protein